MQAFLDDIRSAFDVILFDAPPSIVVADAGILGSKLDGAFLVVEARKTTPQMVARAKAILENVSVTVVGAILNKVKVEGLGYGHYGYHQYSRYYDDGDGTHRHSGAPGPRAFIRRVLLRGSRERKDETIGKGR